MTPTAEGEGEREKARGRQRQRQRELGRDNGNNHANIIARITKAATASERDENFI